MLTLSLVLASAVAGYPQTRPFGNIFQDLSNIPIDGAYPWIMERPRPATVTTPAPRRSWAYLSRLRPPFGALPLPQTPVPDGVLRMSTSQDNFQAEDPRKPIVQGHRAPDRPGASIPGTIPTLSPAPSGATSPSEPSPGRPGVFAPHHPSGSPLAPPAQQPSIPRPVDSAPPPPPPSRPPPPPHQLPTPQYQPALPSVPSPSPLAQDDLPPPPPEELSPVANLPFAHQSPPNHEPSTGLGGALPPPPPPSRPPPPPQQLPSPQHQATPPPLPPSSPAAQDLPPPPPPEGALPVANLPFARQNPPNHEPSTGLGGPSPPHPSSRPPPPAHQLPTPQHQPAPPPSRSSSPSAQDYPPSPPPEGASPVANLPFAHQNPPHEPSTGVGGAPRPQSPPVQPLPSRLPSQDLPPPSPPAQSPSPPDPAAQRPPSVFTRPDDHAMSVVQKNEPAREKGPRADPVNDPLSIMNKQMTPDEEDAVLDEGGIDALIASYRGAPRPAQGGEGQMQWNFGGLGETLRGGAGGNRAMPPPPRVSEPLINDGPTAPQSMFGGMSAVGRLTAEARKTADRAVDLLNDHIGGLFGGGSVLIEGQTAGAPQMVSQSGWTAPGWLQDLMDSAQQLLTRTWNVVADGGKRVTVADAETAIYTVGATMLCGLSIATCIVSRRNWRRLERAVDSAVAVNISSNSEGICAI